MRLVVFIPCFDSLAFGPYVNLFSIRRWIVNIVEDGGQCPCRIKLLFTEQIGCKL